MVLTDYTTYDDIRASLGVGKTEITDVTLSLELYVNGLRAELLEVSPTLPTDYEALPSDASTLTALQENFRVSTRMFATYAVAKHLTISLPLFSPRDITDGKAATSRFNADPYKQVIAGIRAEYERYKSNLVNAHRALYTSTIATISTPISGFRGVRPSYDPVTGI